MSIIVRERPCDATLGWKAMRFYGEDHLEFKDLTEQDKCSLLEGYVNSRLRPEIEGSSFYQANDTGHIEFLEKLGEGTYGHVYKVKWGEKIFAMKLFDVKFENVVDDDDRTYNKMNVEVCLGFMEANGLLRMTLGKKTRFVPKIYDYGFSVIEGKARCYSLIEFIEGKTLREVTAAELTQAKIIKYAHSIFSAVSELHSQGIAHLDISPANIMVGEDKVKLIDFGTCEFPLNEESWYVASTYNPPENYKATVTGPERLYALDVWCAAFSILLILSPHFPPFSYDKMNTPEMVEKDVADRLLIAQARWDFPEILVQALDNDYKKRPPSTWVKSCLELFL